MATIGEHRRSVGFLEKDGDTWACFLVTFPGAAGQWHGYFSFRPGGGGVADDEIRTADIFIEPSEARIHEKARGLGRPLLGGLLSSALHTAERHGRASPRLRGQFRALLAENARELAGNWGRGEPTGSHNEPDLDELRSLYASYRLDQVSHLICLVEPADFEAAVDRILEGERIDFRAKDKLQFSMMVVEYIERLLPLPPFEVWARDFLANRERYRLYAHTLHREGRLP